MKNKCLQSLMLSFVFVLALTSCDDEEKYSLEISKETITIDLKGGQEPIRVITNGYWEVKDIPDWITVNPTSGEKSTDITIIVTENKETIQKSASLLFVCGDISRNLNVKQLSITDLDPFIEIDKNILPMNIQGDEQKVKLTTNRAWKIENAPDWVSVTPTHGEESTEIVIKVKENRQPEGRNLSLEIIAENARKTLTITQPGLKDVVRGPSLPISHFKKISFSSNFDNYDIETNSLFVNPNIKNRIYLGNLISHNAGSNVNIPEFAGYSFNPIDVYTTAAVNEVTTKFTPSQTAQADFVRDIIAQNPQQQERFSIDKSGVEFYTYRQLHTVGMVNLGVKLDELISEKSFTQQEMTKKYGIIFSFKQVLFSLGMDFPMELIKEKLSESDLSKGVSYVSTVSYGRIGLLIVESDTDSRELKIVINKVIEGTSLTAEESNLIHSADISHVYFTNDNEVIVKKGGLEAVDSYKNAILNLGDNIYMLDFTLSDFTNHSNNTIHFSFKISE